MKKTVKYTRYDRDFSPTGSTFTNYYFKIGFTDGEVGEFSTSKKEQTKFIVNTEYDVFIKKTTQKGTKMWDITREEKPKFVSSYNDPASIKRIAFSVAQSVAAKYCELLETDIEYKEIQEISINIYKWIISEGGDKSRDIASLRWNSCERTLNSFWLLPSEAVTALLDNVVVNVTSAILSVSRRDMNFLNTNAK